MPFLGDAAAGVGGLLTSILGGISGATNKRPPSLDPTQRGGLDQLIKSILPTATGNPTIDPIQQALMYGNIAQGQTGANNAVTHALVSRGLGQSGLLGGALTQVANQGQALQNQANLGLQQQAIQQKDFSGQLLNNLFNVGNIPGQSTAGGFFAGMAPLAAYSIQNAMNQRGAGGGFYGGGLTPMPGDNPGQPTGNLPLPKVPL